MKNALTCVASSESIVPSDNRRVQDGERRKKKGGFYALSRVTRQLEEERVKKFNKPFDKLVETLAQRSLRRLTRES